MKLCTCLAAMFKSHIRKENCLRSSNVNGSRMAFPAERNKQSPFRRIGPKSTRSLLKSHSWTHLFHSTPLTGNRIIYFPEDIKFVCHMINTMVVVEVMEQIWSWPMRCMRRWTRRWRSCDGSQRTEQY